jgi:aryl-alcohol dehydrogenase-like predicted oxidoreductase
MLSDPGAARSQSSRSRPSRASTLSGGASPKRRCCRPARNLGSASFPYSPLGRGFLTGKIDETATFGSNDNRSALPRFTLKARKANRPMVRLLEEIGDQKAATAAQIALAWLLARKPWVVPISGTTKLQRLEENIDAAALKFTPDDRRHIEDAASHISVQGDRYLRAEKELTGR